MDGIEWQFADQVIQFQNASSFQSLLKSVQLAPATSASIAATWRSIMLSPPDPIVQYMQAYVWQQQASKNASQIHSMDATKPFLIMIHAAWCHACKEAKPKLNTFAKTYHKYGIPTYAIEGKLLFDMSLQDDLGANIYDSHGESMRDKKDMQSLISYYPVIVAFHPPTGQFIQIARADDLDQVGKLLIAEAQH